MSIVRSVSTLVSGATGDDGVVVFISFRLFDVSNQLCVPCNVIARTALGYT